MKTPPPAPTLQSLPLTSYVQMKRLVLASQNIDDRDYLHWDKLRHLAPPDDLTHEQWWWVLKRKRSANAMRIPQLRARRTPAKRTI